MQCPECQSQSRDGDRFCRECGAKLYLVCSRCGHEVSPQDKFCGECGTELEWVMESSDEDKVRLRAEDEKKEQEKRELAPEEKEQLQAAIERRKAETMSRFVHYAGFWRRLIALFIDTLILLIVYFGTVYAVGRSPSIGRVVSRLPMTGYVDRRALLSILDFLVWLLYYAVMERSSLQGTLGKMFLGIVVTDSSGNRISFLKAIGRNLGKVISALPLNMGFIMAGFAKEKRALHDIMAGCLVVIR